MLIRIEIENFFSIDGRQVLDFPVAANVPDPDQRFVETLPGLRVPKVAVIYGANGSGKTTILRALVFLRDFLARSFTQDATASLPDMAFHTSAAAKRQSILKVEFSGSIVTPEPCRHVYELVLAPGPDEALVVQRESLTFAPKGRPRRLFLRDGNSIRGSNDFQISDHDPRLASVRSNASVVSTLAQFNHGPSLTIRHGLDSVVQNNFFLWKVAIEPKSVIPYYLEKAERLGRLNAILPTLDIGIGAVRVMQGDKGPIAVFDHAGLHAPLPLTHQSGGTRTFFALFPLLDMALEEGGIAVIDEIDADLHPLVLSEVVRWFADPARNPRHAQLIATCQNPNLLDHLQKEEVWFTEKDGLGRTKVFGLKDIQGVRRTENLQRKYIEGSFGAIPRLG